MAISLMGLYHAKLNESLPVIFDLVKNNFNLIKVNEMYQEIKNEVSLNAIRHGFLIDIDSQFSADGTSFFAIVRNSKNIPKDHIKEDLTRISSIRKVCEIRRDYWKNQKRIFGI